VALGISYNTNRLATIIGGWLCYLVRYEAGEREAVWYSDNMLIERRK
jgi:hypothetical protein